MSNLVKSICWICRDCGHKNDVSQRKCLDCNQNGRSTNTKSVFSQFINPNANLVQNNVYNFAEEPEIESPEIWEAQPETRPKFAQNFGHSFIMITAVIATWLGIIVVGSIFSFMVWVVWTAFTRTH